MGWITQICSASGELFLWRVSCFRGQLHSLKEETTSASRMDPWYSIPWLSLRSKEKDIIFFWWAGQLWWQQQMEAGFEKHLWELKDELLALFSWACSVCCCLLLNYSICHEAMRSQTVKILISLQQSGYWRCWKQQTAKLVRYIFYQRTHPKSPKN